MEERFKVSMTVGLILINKENEILLMKRCNTGYMDNKYDLVAGHLEKNESLSCAMIREAKEEIGIDICSKDIEFVCAIRRGDNDTYVNNYFKCNKYEGSIENLEKQKCSELKWFDINNLPRNIIPNDKRAINNMINNIVLDEYDFK